MTASIVTITSKTNRGQDVQLIMYVAVTDKPGGCIDELTCGNTKFHPFFKFMILVEPWSTVIVM